MENKKYKSLMINPPKLEVKENASEVVLKVVSSMCDNRYTLSFNKKQDGYFKMCTHGFAYSNFSIPIDEDDLEWIADDGNWPEVFKLINSGTILIESVKSR